MACVYRTLSKLLINPKPSFIINPHISKFTLKSHIYPSNFTSFRHYCAVEGGAFEETPEITQTKRLFVFNFPWSSSYDDLKKTFSECGTVKESKIVRTKDGNNRAYAFITMSSVEEAQAAIDKFDSKEFGGRTIKVEFSTAVKKPRPQSSTGLPAKVTRHKLHVSNLPWGVRATHLKEFFSADFNPVSVKVAFSGPSKSAGFGFVIFNTKEEAEAAKSSLNGKEILGRPVGIQFSKRKTKIKGEAADKDGKDEGKENQDDSVGPVGEEEVIATEQKS